MALQEKQQQQERRIQEKIAKEKAREEFRHRFELIQAEEAKKAAELREKRFLESELKVKENEIMEREKKLMYKEDFALIRFREKVKLKIKEAARQQQRLVNPVLKSNYANPNSNNGYKPKMVAIVQEAFKYHALPSDSQVDSTTPKNHDHNDDEDGYQYFYHEQSNRQQSQSVQPSTTGTNPSPSFVKPSHKKSAQVCPPLCSHRPCPYSFSYPYDHCRSHNHLYYIAIHPWQSLHLTASVLLYRMLSWK
jgi:hypothetical protein